MLDQIVVPLEQIGERADLLALFERDAPTELEIGCGKGGFLLRQARAHPERNYLGIEWANKYFRYAADRMARWGVANVRILRTDARHFVVYRLAPASLAAMHVYHPDPWPKKRHHKRRLFTPEFVDAAVASLAPGGRLAIQTDDAEYFAVIRALAASHPLLAEVSSLSIPSFDKGGLRGVAAADQRVETNYEIKYLREGRSIFRIAFIRRESGL